MKGGLGLELLSIIGKVNHCGVSLAGSLEALEGGLHRRFVSL